jgi:hypothetical protein
LISGLNALPDTAKDKETLNRIEALKHLLGKPIGEFFDGKSCHRCGDAIICMEARANQTVITKNRKHFVPLTDILKKPLAVCEAPP